MCGGENWKMFVKNYKKCENDETEMSELEFDY